MEAHVVPDLLPPWPARPDVPIVLAEDCAVPPWVESWCRHVDRPVQVRSVTGEQGGIGVIAEHPGSSVLLPHARSSLSSAPERVVAAVRDLPDDDAVLAAGASVARELDTGLALVHAVPLSFAERSVRLDEAMRHGRRVLDRAVERLAATAPEVPVQTELVRCRPHELVGADLDAVLLVLGGPRAARPARVGLVTSSAVQHAGCSVLLVPRPSRPEPDRTAVG